MAINTEHFKNFLKEKHLNTSQLSRLTGVPRQTLDNWIAGQEPGKVSQLKKVSDYFNLSLNEVFWGECLDQTSIHEYQDEINAGVFEVVLRRIKCK